MFEPNPFFLREARQHARRPLPLQLGLLALTGAFAFVLLLTLHLWNRLGRGPDPPDPLVGFLVFPHVCASLAAGIYGTDRIFGEEHRRSTLEALFLLPLTHGRWLAQRLLWPCYLVLVTWIAGFPVYVVASLVRIGTPTFNFQLSLIPLAAGVAAILLTLLLPPDYRERMRAARTATGTRQRTVDVDLTLTWLIFAGLGLLFQGALVSRLWLSGGIVSFYNGRLQIGLVLIVVAVAVFAAAMTVAMATVSREDRWVRVSQQARIVAAGTLYYAVTGLLLGTVGWSRLSIWVQWGAPLLFPLGMWLLLRSQSRPKEDRLAVGEVEWAEHRWANPVLTRDLRSFTRFSSIRRWIANEFLVLVGIYGLMLYLFVWKGTESVGSVTRVTLALAAIFGTLIVIGDVSARPFAMWTKERTTGALTMLFLLPRSSGELLRARLFSGLIYSLLTHLPLLLLAIVGIFWHVGSAPAVVGAILLTFSPIAGLFFVVLGCTVQPQTAPPWQWHRDDWWEAALAILQIGLLVVDVIVMATSVTNPFLPAWPLAALFFLLNTAVVYGCYRVRVRQFEALRIGERALSER